MSFHVDETDFTPLKQRETELATKILAKLMKEFPGYDWHVNVSADAEVATVRTEFGGSFGFVLHLDKVIYDPDMAAVRWAGGETLERYGLSRERADQAAINSLALNAKGFAIPQVG